MIVLGSRWPAFWIRACGGPIGRRTAGCQLATAATNRGRYRRACQLLAAAAWHGSTAALEAMAWRRLICGDADTARRLSAKAVNRGDQKARIAPALICDGAGDEDAALEVARQAIRDVGDPAALLALKQRFRSRGKTERTADLMREIPPGFSGAAATETVERMRRVGSVPPTSAVALNGLRYRRRRPEPAELEQSSYPDTNPGFRKRRARRLRCRRPGKWTARPLTRAFVSAIMREQNVS